MLFLLFIALAAPLALVAFALGARFGFRRGRAQGQHLGAAGVYQALAERTREVTGRDDMAAYFDQFASEEMAAAKKGGA